MTTLRIFVIMPTLLMPPKSALEWIKFIPFKKFTHLNKLLGNSQTQIQKNPPIEPKITCHFMMYPKKNHLQFEGNHFVCPFLPCFHPASKFQTSLLHNMKHEIFKHKCFIKKMYSVIPDLRV
jgi:hypothetical protein